MLILSDGVVVVGWWGEEEARLERFDGFGQRWWWHEGV
jgi:hypothetical protein